MSDIKFTVCPKCGSRVRVEDGKSAVMCLYCGKLFAVIQDMFGEYHAAERVNDASKTKTPEA